MSLGYQAIYTVPRWRRLVSAHLVATGTSSVHALGLLTGFGAFYNLHNIAQVLRQQCLWLVITCDLDGLGLSQALHGCFDVATEPGCKGSL